MITVIEYIAHNNPEALQNVIVNYGIEPAHDIDDLINKTEYLYTWSPQQIEPELLNLHPDKNQIIQFYLANQANPEKLTIQPTIPNYKPIPAHSDSGLIKAGLAVVVVVALYQLLK